MTKKIEYENSSNQKDTPELISYQQLRALVGLTGFFLPIILVIGTILKKKSVWIDNSISHYYYSNMGDVFVGLLCTVAIFLFTYKGHEKDKEDFISDNLAGNLACIFALGVAFFPCAENDKITFIKISSIHFGSAALFFITLAYFSICKFTKSKGHKTAEKMRRNTIYRICGYVILTSIALLGIYQIPIVHVAFEKFKPVIVFETISLWAFAFSWMVKGELFFKDKNK